MSISTNLHLGATVGRPYMNKESVQYRWASGGAMQTRRPGTVGHIHSFLPLEYSSKTARAYHSMSPPLFP
jgi:hypothetical protein